MYTLMMKDPLPPEVDLEAELADPPVAQPSHGTPAPAQTADHKHDSPAGIHTALPVPDIY
jgi:hypothetical protein